MICTKQNFIKLQYVCDLYTVEPVYSGHFWDHQNMVVIGRWLLYRNTVNNKHLKKWSLCNVIFFKKSQPVRSDVKSTLGKTNLLQSLQKLQTTLRSSQNLLTTLQSSWGSQTTLIKYVEAANNFTEFVGLANKF